MSSEKVKSFKKLLTHWKLLVLMDWFLFLFLLKIQACFILTRPLGLLTLSLHLHKGADKGREKWNLSDWLEFHFYSLIKWSCRTFLEQFFRNKQADFSSETTCSPLLALQRRNIRYFKRGLSNNFLKNGFQSIVIAFSVLC